MMKNLLDNRDDGIPLSGGLRNPQPVTKVGHIEKGADIIFGIPTVKVWSKNNFTLSTIFLIYEILNGIKCPVKLFPTGFTETTYFFIVCYCFY